MLSKIDRYFQKNSAVTNFIFFSLFLAIIGYIDYLAGRETIMSVFYAMPIIFISWYNSIVSAIASVFIVTILWFFTDYFSNPHYSHPLIPFWNSFVRCSFFFILVFLIQKVKKLLELEKSHARLDPLTSLLNNRGLHEFASAEINRLSRTGRPFTLAYFDLDNFKAVNDTFGHESGDKLLIEIANILKKYLRTTDRSARIGGDEFVILLPETDSNAARAVINKIQDSLNRLMNMELSPVTASIGVLTFESPPPSVNAMLKMADDLMYKVKNEGKNNALFQSYRNDAKHA